MARNTTLLLVFGLAGLLLVSGANAGAGARLPRGIRNNNPGNIEYNPFNDWLGQTGSDGRYVIFSHHRWGIRAMRKVLESYRRRGLTTLEEIIATWAPASENNTQAYILSVSERMGVYSGHVVMPVQYFGLIEAMIYHENGTVPYSDAEIRAGIDLA